MNPDDIVKRARERAIAIQEQLDVRHTKSGIIVLPTFKNATIYLDSDAKLSKLFRYNELSESCEVSRTPPWGTLGKYPKDLTDDEAIQLRKYMAFEYNIDFSQTTIDHAITSTTFDNSYNPAKVFLQNLEWDKQPRVEMFLTEYLGVVDTPLNRYISKMTLSAACARIDKPGVKYDYMLILEGEQGVGKSEAVKALGGEWFKEVSLMDRSTTTVELMQGAWIIEVPELSVFKKKDIESLKAFLSTGIDKIRLPYGRRSKIFPRKSIFIGTINPGDLGYLSDATGNRRFLPVLCGEIKVGKIRADREQIWAEAWQIYQAGQQLYLPKEFSLDVNKEQRQRESFDDWQPEIERYVSTREKVTSSEIWIEGFGKHIGDINRVHQLRISRCMKQIGWTRHVFRKGSIVVKGYVRGPHATPMDQIVIPETETPWDE